MAKWKQKPLGEVTAFMSKGIPPKYMDAESSSTIRVLNQKCNRNFMISYTESRLHNNAIKPVPREKLLRNGDVLINSTGTGTAGRVAQILKVPTPTTIDGHMILLRPAKELDLLYYGYAIKAQQAKIEELAEGSTGQTEINRKRLQEEIVITYPEDLRVQHDIGYFLMEIDDKIELNNAINNNLEQQAQALFKSWYQQFSKADGVPLVESEFGLIPKGWHYALLGDLCKSVSVTHKFDKNELIFLNTGDIANGRFLHSDYMAVKNMPGQAKKTIAPGDILYSEIRPINRHFAYVNFPTEDYVVSTKLMVIRANGFDARRLYHFLTSDDIIIELQRQAESRSGTFPQIRFDNISKLPILIADKETESEFITILHSVYDQIEHNNLESKKLSALRDALLPKLMSGELDVSEIDL